MLGRGIAGWNACPLDLQSTAGEGSRFSFVLELPRAAAEPETGIEKAKAGGKFADLRIPVADDNRDNRRVISMILKKLGVAPQVVEDGQQAVDAVAERDFDVILMDVQMPVMDGLEATREIRRRQCAAARRPQIVAVTANAFEGARQECLMAGMDDYVTKPINAKKLAMALSAAREAAELGPGRSPSPGRNQGDGA